MAHFLIQLVSSGGLIAILLLMAGESAGLPISSEVVVPLGGALASGALPGGAPFNLAEVVIASTVGNLLGSLVAYVLVRRYGARVILGPGRRVGLSEGHMRLAERFFDRFGLAAVFLGRLLPIIRTYISFPAGLSKRITTVPFITYTLVGATIWNFALGYVGYGLGKNYDRVEKSLGWLSIPFILLVLVLIGAAYYFGKQMKVEERLAGETGRTVD